MTDDLLLKLANGRLTRRITRVVGLPSPRVLPREEGAYAPTPLADRIVVVSGAPGGFAAGALHAMLTDLGADVVLGPPADPDARVDVSVFDATGCTTPESLRALYEFFHALARRFVTGARVLVVASEPADADDPTAAATARAVEGFVRALGKEIGRRGATANLVYVRKSSVDRLRGPVRFFCTHRSAYVSGQAVHVDDRVTNGEAQGVTRPLAGKVALVTGAARGLGAATARRLGEEGAHVVCLDVPGARDALEETARDVGGTPLALDVTSEDAPGEIAAFLADRSGGVDAVVHNAGITRDRTLGKMTPAEWDGVMAVNFQAITRIDGALAARDLVREGGRIVCLSSVSGIAGNAGQTNYSATKAALIGYVAARARELAPRGVTINAVAPGFIETDMTARMPRMLREAGRRLNALSQGGEPRDVAELVTFLASPDAVGVTGQTIRVCGQALIGA